MLRSDGSLDVWGSSDAFGLLSGAPVGNDFIAVAANDFHSLALRSDGTVAGWGYDHRGQVSNTPNDVIAIAVGVFHSLALRSDGTVVSWGSDDFGLVTSTPQDDGFIAIAAGTSLNLAIRGVEAAPVGPVTPGVPEPASAALVGMGAFVLFARRLRSA